MLSTEVLTGLLFIILFIIILDRMGRLFQKCSPETLRYVDYGSFSTAIVTGVVIYAGKGNTVVWYLFFASLIIYFITLRHTAHRNSSPGE